MFEDQALLAGALPAVPNDRAGWLRVSYYRAAGAPPPAAAAEHRAECFRRRWVELRGRYVYYGQAPGRRREPALGWGTPASTGPAPEMRTLVSVFLFPRPQTRPEPALRVWQGTSAAGHRGPFVGFVGNNAGTGNACP
eukprot:gene8259-biopygen12726